LRSTRNEKQNIFISCVLLVTIIRINPPRSVCRRLRVHPNNKISDNSRCGASYPLAERLALDGNEKQNIFISCVLLVTIIRINPPKSVCRRLRVHPNNKISDNSSCGASYPLAERLGLDGNEKQNIFISCVLLVTIIRINPPRSVCRRLRVHPNNKISDNSRCGASYPLAERLALDGNEKQNIFISCVLLVTIIRINPPRSVCRRLRVHRNNKISDNSRCGASYPLAERLALDGNEKQNIFISCVLLVTIIRINPPRSVCRRLRVHPNNKI